MSQTDTIVGLGARTDYVAPAPNVDPSRLTADEGQVLASIGRAAQIQELLRRSTLGEPKTIALLLALRAKGAIVPARVHKPAGSDAPVTAAMAEEVDLDPARKQEILDLERMIDSANHFEVLGLSPGAAPDEVKRAFYDASRRYHPDRYFGKNLGSFKGRIERIFRRLSEANQVLTDPEKRSAYLKANPTLASPASARSSPSSGGTAAPPRPKSAQELERDAERRSRFARHPYLAKSGRVAGLVAKARENMEKGEFGQAYNDLHVASQMDDKNVQVKELLAQVRKKNEALRRQEELKRGEEAERRGDLQAALLAYRAASTIDPSDGRAAYLTARTMLRLSQDAKEIRPFAQRAVDADAGNADYRVVLGEVLLEAGLKDLAQKHFERALEIDPDHAGAKKHVKKWWPF